MAQIYVTNSLGTNAGKAAGSVKMGRPKVLLMTRGANPTASDLADSDSLFAFVKSCMNSNRTASAKIFLIDGLHEAEDKTGDPQKGTLADGYEEVLNEALPKFIFKLTKGVAEQQSLVTFNGWNDKVFIIDDKGIFWYRGDGGTGGVGFSVGAFYAKPPNFGNTGNINVGIIDMTFANIDEFKNNVGALKIGFTSADLPNIVDAALSSVSATGYAFKVAVKNKYQGSSIGAAYAVGLAQSGAWGVTLPDGTNVVVSSVAYDATTDSFTVTVASSPTITTGVKLKFVLNDPSILAGLVTPVLGIEGVPVLIAKP